MTTHHSEYLELKTCYIKHVSQGFVSDDLLNDQWKPLNYLEKPDFGLASREYGAFEHFLLKNEVELLRFPFDSRVGIDSIYCRDASIATDFGMILCRMGKRDRVNEPGSHRDAFEVNSIPVLGEITSPGTLEGGDVAWLDPKTLAAGHTYRTNKEGIAQLRALLEPRGITVLAVDLPHYKGPADVFHLMSVLSPIDKDLAVVYSPLMPIRFRNQLLERGFRLVEVPEKEFESMGCNVLAVAPRKCVMVDGNPITRELLLEAGCEVFSYRGRHISIMGGGGPTCLTRPLLRGD